MNASALALLLAAPALAGCVAPSTAPGPAAGETPPASLALAGCEVQASLFPLPPGTAARFLPGGFEPTYAGAAAEVLVVFGFDCADVSSPGLASRAARSLWWLLPVTPPAAYRQAGVDAHWAVLGMASDDPATDRVLGAWGVPPAPAVEVALRRDAAAPAVWEGRWEATAAAWRVAVESTALGNERGHQEEWNRAYAIGAAGGAPRAVAAFDFRGEGENVRVVGPEGTASLQVTGDARGFPATSASGVPLIERSDGLWATLARVELPREGP